MSRRGMATSITWVSENNGQVMSVKVIPVSAPSLASISPCSLDYSIVPNLKKISKLGLIEASFR